jgi:hypothetical protein
MATLQDAVLDEHKKIYDFLTFSHRRLSVATEVLTEPGGFLEQWSAMDSPILMNEDQFDILTFFDDPDDSTVLPYVCPCDPAVIVGQESERARMTTFKPPYLKATFQITNCDPSFYDAELEELLSRPFESNTPRDRLNKKIASLLRRTSNRMAATERRQWRDFLIKGKAYVAGPNIKPSESWIDLRRDPHLTAVLPVSQAWSKSSADKVGALRNVENMVRDLSGKFSEVTHHILSPEAATALLSEDDKITSIKCCLGDGRIREDIQMDLLQQRAFRGARRMEMLLGNRGVQFWELDEKEWVEEVQVDGTTKKVRKPILPPGSILTIAASDLRPLSLYGRIEHLEALEARQRWTKRWESPDGECINYTTHSSPLHTLRCTNSTALGFPLPETCPPPADCPVVELESTAGDVKS